MPDRVCGSGQISSRTGEVGVLEPAGEGGFVKPEVLRGFEEELLGVTATYTFHIQLYDKIAPKLTAEKTYSPPLPPASGWKRKSRDGR